MDILKKIMKLQILNKKSIMNDMFGSVTVWRLKQITKITFFTVNRFK